MYNGFASRVHFFTRATSGLKKSPCIAWGQGGDGWVDGWGALGFESADCFHDGSECTMDLRGGCIFSRGLLVG